MISFCPASDFVLHASNSELDIQKGYAGNSVETHTYSRLPPKYGAISSSGIYRPRNALGVTGKGSPEEEKS
jgi:hypothetical protein